MGAETLPQQVINNSAAA